MFYFIIFILFVYSEHIQLVKQYSKLLAIVVGHRGVCLLSNSFLYAQSDSPVNEPPTDTASGLP